MSSGQTQPRHPNDRRDCGDLQGKSSAMLLFCPGCGNGLIVEEGQRCHRFACNTCPYVHNITRKVRSGARRRAGRRPQASRRSTPAIPRVRLYPPVLSRPLPIGSTFEST